MEHINLSTNLLVQKLTDNEYIAIVKYQSLWAMLEHQPDDKTALRHMTRKQLELAKLWQDSIKMSVSSELDSINRRRTRQKKSYEKQKVGENSDAANKMIEDAEGENKEKVPHTPYKEIKIKPNGFTKSFLPEFETWWAEYPNKKSKQDALKIFEKLMAREQVSFDELLAGAKAYAEHCRREKTDPHYIKHPSTWLNQGCWADEYAKSVDDNQFHVEW